MTEVIQRVQIFATKPAKYIAEARLVSTHMGDMIRACSVHLGSHRQIDVKRFVIVAGYGDCVLGAALRPVELRRSCSMSTRDLVPDLCGTRISGADCGNTGGGMDHARLALASISSVDQLAEARAFLSGRGSLTLWRRSLFT